MNYKDKYIKYKIKYLTLKNNQTGANEFALRIKSISINN